MPHDCNGDEIKAGDMVTMRFKVAAVSASETECNVTLDAVSPEDREVVYLPTVSCNACLVEKVDGDE